MTQLPLSDRRAFGRRPTYHHAVVYRSGRTPLRCVVLDISTGGALLDFGGPVHLPGRVRLAWDGYDLEVECDVRHADGFRVGVQFLSDIGARIIDDIASHKAPAKVASKIAIVETDSTPRHEHGPAITTASADAPACLVQRARARIAAEIIAAREGKA
jgi:PilZ domain